MTREQIEKAALLFAGAGEWGECPYNPDAKNGFMAGAHWLADRLCHLPLDRLVQELAEYINQKEEQL